uniref:Tr-type G domain-containing protein n=1 Tax=Heterorhabditis bacteriophora TaxID=37862 RepID=A0A1I7X1X3_HETBA
MCVIWLERAQRKQAELPELLNDPLFLSWGDNSLAMDVVVYLALAVLAAVFVVSLIVLLLMCQRRRMQSRSFKVSFIFKTIVSSPQVLDRNNWVYDVSGVLQHCVALLRLCHTLTDKLSAVPLHHAPHLNDLLCEATLRVMPRFDDLLGAVASPASLGEPLREMDQHLEALKQAAEIFERADIGKLEMDWSRLDAIEGGDEDDSAKVHTETTPLVESPATAPVDSISAAENKRVQMTSLMELLVEALGSKSPEEIRNVCLIAHVDHGKTSFADSLVSTNSVISCNMYSLVRMAGKLRFLDSREDEQTRGITMKASGISLLYGPMLVNLMDSPGHVDFSQEVTSALLLSDIALLLIDVVSSYVFASLVLLKILNIYFVEGVCSQTEALLRQAITNGQTIILVINKLDRYVLFRCFCDCFQRLIYFSQVVGGLVLEDDSWKNIEEFESQLHFDPSKGNVIFSSALHSYAFGIEDFANIYSDRLKVSKSELITTLFGDFYIQGGKIKTDLTGKLGVSLKSRRVSEAFDEAMRAWMPIPRACFRACARVTSAKLAFTKPYRIQRLVGRKCDHPLAEVIERCCPQGITLLYVVKFIWTTDRKVAICRVLSGRVKKGDQLFVLGKKGAKNMADIPRTIIDGIWMLKGRDTIPINVATAGVICAIDADGLIQNATLCSECISEGLDIGQEIGEPLVRVSVNTTNLEDMEKLKQALKLLSFLDSSLRVLELETGELAMVTAGEVHLQKCLKDLEDLNFTNLEVSAPIVPFLETAIPDSQLTQIQIQEQITSSDILDTMRRGQIEDSKVIIFKRSENDIKKFIDKIWSFGPDRARANILINLIPDYNRKSIWNKSDVYMRPLDQAIISGFELFVNSGPLCHEVMRGVAVLIEEWKIDETDTLVAGQLMSAMRATCKAAAKKLALRLVAAMYRCIVTTASQSLGKVHAVLSQRKAKVLNEDINEATGLFEVEALMPVVESFSFCDHLRKNTSGMASAQLEFSHWQLIDEVH